MIKFVKHITVAGNEIRTTLFDDVPIADVYSKTGRVNEEYLVLRHGDKDYTVDLNRLLVNEDIELTPDLSIKNVVSLMTDQHLYTYALPALKNFENQLIILSYGDYRSKVSMSASNKSLDEDSPLINDPGFQDVSIRIPGVDLTNVIPVIGNNIYMPSWKDGNIFIPGVAKILLNNPELLLMTTTEGSPMKVESITAFNSVVDMVDGYVPVLVLDGRLALPTEKHLDISNNQIRLSQVARDRIDSLAEGGYDPMPNTFIMFLKGKKLLTKEINTSDIAGSIVEFSDASRLVLVTDQFGYVHSCVTKEFTGLAETRQYCYTDMVKPQLRQLFLI